MVYGQSARIREGIQAGRIQAESIQIAFKKEMNIPVEDPQLPAGFRFALYQGTLEERLKWAEIMCSVGFCKGSLEQGLKSFEHEFGPDLAFAKRRVYFVISDKDKREDGNGEYVGTCAAWEDKNLGINVIHWLGVRPEYQEYGLGKALVEKMLWVYQKETPGKAVYLTSQTDLISAVCLYLKEGFLPVYGDEKRKEKYEKAVLILKDILRDPCREEFLHHAVDERGIQLF